jgi:methylenetetrahydrofolate dehydrogenase (NADP+)/methenyltetrahydrofolate cyclohydrolase
MVTLPADATSERIRSTIEKFNNSRTIYGIILQLPLPRHLRSENAETFIRPEKDVDGFLPHSPFDPPVSLAVLLLLNMARAGERGVSDGRNQWEFTAILRDLHDSEFLRWLRSKTIVIVGRGETAGAPVAASLAKLDCATFIVHAKTHNPDRIIRSADIVVACVGKKGIVRKDSIKPGAILIGVGIWRDRTGKLHGDYEDEDVADTASFYTPTPGGVGPVNVACLMGNLVLAAQHAS